MFFEAKFLRLGSFRDRNNEGITKRILGLLGLVIFMGRYYS